MRREGMPFWISVDEVVGLLLLSWADGGDGGARMIKPGPWPFRDNGRSNVMPFAISSGFCGGTGLGGSEP